MTHADRVIALAERIDYLERLLSRAYPLMSNPYTQQTDPYLATLYDSIISDVEHAIQHVPDEDDPPVTLPCGSCDGTGRIGEKICPNCTPISID